MDVGFSPTPRPRSIIVAGDGRYHNSQAIPIIAHLAAANGIRDIWIPQFGIMSTPAVSAAIRRRRPEDDDGNASGGGRDGEGVAQGGIVLTASHNPGGPGEDFGIKYNEGLGQPAGEDFTEAVSHHESDVVAVVASAAAAVGGVVNYCVGRFIHLSMACPTRSNRAYLTIIVLFHINVFLLPRSSTKKHSQYPATKHSPTLSTLTSRHPWEHNTH